MKLRALTIAELDNAVELLKEGFGELSGKSWRDSLLNVFAHAETLGESSVGSVVFNKESDIGICLALPSRRFAYEEEPRKVVNLAAFYLKPQHQWLASVVLRRMMTDTEADYVDLTPSHSMRKVNELLGFTTGTTGLVVVALAGAALRRGMQTKIVPYEYVSADKLSDGVRAMMAAHAKQNCLCLIAEHQGQYHPLILKRKKRAGLSAVRVLLVKDRSFLNGILGPLARYLLRQGCFLLEVEGSDKAGSWEAVIRPKSPYIQSTKPSGNGAIDHTFSELVFIL